MCLCGTDEQKQAWNYVDEPSLFSSLFSSVSNDPNSNYCHILGTGVIPSQLYYGFIV